MRRPSWRTGPWRSWTSTRRRSSARRPSTGATDLAAVDDVTALLVLPAVVEDPEAAAAKLAEILGGDASDLSRRPHEGRRDQRPDRRRHDDRGAHGPQGGHGRGRARGRGVPAGLHDGRCGRLRRHVPRRRRRDDRDGGARGRRSRPRPGQRGRRRDAALRHVHRRHDGRPGDHRDLDHRRPRGERARGTRGLPAAGTRHARRLRRRRRSWSTCWGRRPTAPGRPCTSWSRTGRASSRTTGCRSRPRRWSWTTTRTSRATSRGSLLPFAAGGEAVSLDVGSYTFAWRLPGVIMGALTVAVLFLLARVLFRRRSVARPRRAVRAPGRDALRPEPDRDERRLHGLLHPGRLPAVRLAVAGTRTRQALPSGSVMPAMGVLLGLALASKWVAAYAIGALGILVLIRSALGRILLIIGMIGITGVLGWMGLAVPDGQRRGREPPVHPDHDRPHAGDGGADRLSGPSPGRTTRCASPSRRRPPSGS